MLAGLQVRVKLKCRGWKFEAWSFIADEFRKRFHITIEIKQFKAYAETLERDYATVKELLN